MANTNSTKNQTRYMKASRKTYTYKYIKSPTGGIAEVTPELGQFASDIAMDLWDDPKMKAYSKFVTKVCVERKWVKVILLKGTPQNIKDKIRDYLIKSNYLFTGKPYQWSPSNRYNKKECYLALGPKSINCGYTPGGFTGVNSKVYITRN